jgi:hypothetical protein
MGAATQIIVEMKDVLDDIVLDPAAENSRAGCRGTMRGSS